MKVLQKLERFKCSECGSELYLVECENTKQIKLACLTDTCNKLSEKLYVSKLERRPLTKDDLKIGYYYKTIDSIYKLREICSDYAVFYVFADEGLFDVEMEFKIKNVPFNDAAYAKMEQVEEDEAIKFVSRHFKTIMNTFFDSYKDAEHIIVA